VEDTELCTRAQLKGWKLAIDASTYVHHFGQQTLLQLGNKYPPVHRANQLSFMAMYYDETPKKLIATFRVRDQPDFLRRSLARAAEFCDGIIVLCHQAPKLLEVLEVDKDWDLYRDRSMMMESAKKHHADWIFALDADEFIEDSFTYEVAHRLMHPSNPSTFAYSFPFCTFFLGDTHYRSDGIFGDMRGLRMYRNLPNQHPRMVRHKKRTCLACPSLPPFNVVNLRYRIKHYGYHSQEVCDRKYKFYTDLDPNPDKGYIGPRGYAHLIDPNFSLIRWREKNDCALCMIVRDEELNLFSFLYRYAAYFDQIVIVDTGSKDNTREVAQIFDAEVHPFKWQNDFAAARNYAKSLCTTSWIFTPDPDEELDQRDIGTLFKMMEAPVHAWLFQIVNFQPDDSVFYSDNVRLLRNIPEVYWTHFSHENITEATRENKLIVQIAPFKIKHYGYLKTPEVQQQKAKAYGRMLKKELRENPKEAICHFHLAFHHFEKGQETRGLQSLHRALKLQPDLFIASKELGLRHLTLAGEYLRKTADTVPAGHYFHQWAQRITRTIAQALQTHID
jgi:GT2 family glycosyltransferase